MVDFSKLKAMSGKKSLEALTSELNKVSGGEGKSADDRFWTPTVDKAGNGDRKSTRLNSSHVRTSRMPSSA